MANRANYRPEIDGLRTVAVMAVLFYHVGFAWMPGGFVGVDVFFVISGFLITQKIWNERVATGTFSFSNFYRGRIRRLFPALYVTATASLVAGYFLFPPDLMQELAMSTITALLSVSNFFFWTHSGYFDTGNQFRPLLHTWSLSVEEQFYLIWPLLLVFLGRFSSRRAPALALAVICLVSLVLSVIFLGDRASIYYLLPFRVFELGIGGLVVFGGKFAPRNEVAKATLFALGIAVIIACCLLYDEKTVFPSYNAVLPCVATALVIFAGRPISLGWILTNRVAVGIGAISYSLYLAHWPIMVFYRYQAVGSQGEWQKAGLVAASLLAAVILYKVIENPIRRRTALAVVPGWKFALSFVAACSVAIAPAWGGYQHGWPSRYSAEILSLIDGNFSDQGSKAYPLSCFMSPPMSFTNIDERCYKAVENGKKNILVLGDSTAYHLVTGLYTLLEKDANVLAWASSQCPAVMDYSPPTNPQCREIMNHFFSVVVPQNRYDLVVVSNYKAWDVMKEKFGDSLKRLQDRGAEVVVVGETLAYRDTVINILARSKSLDQVADAFKGRISIGCDGGEYGMDRLVGEDRFFSMKQLLCPGGETPLYGVEGRLIYRDHIHFNGYGSVFVAKHLIEWMKTRSLL